jgi:hypothetical protein
MWCKKIVLAMGMALALSCSFGANASDIPDGNGHGLSQSNFLTAGIDQLLPGIAVWDAPTVAPVAATYALNGNDGMEGVMWSFKDFRTVADSGGASA